MKGIVRLVLVRVKKCCCTLQCSISGLFFTTVTDTDWSNEILEWSVLSFAWEFCGFQKFFNIDEEWRNEEESSGARLSKTLCILRHTQSLGRKLYLLLIKLWSRYWTISEMIRDDERFLGSCCWRTNMWTVSSWDELNPCIVTAVCQLMKLHEFCCKWIASSVFSFDACPDSRLRLTNHQKLKS